MDGLDLLKPEFNISDLSWDQKLRVSGTLLENRDLYPKVLGKIARGFTSKERRDFVDELEKSTGQKVSATSIRVYAWMFEKVWSLPECPADLSLKAVKLIAGMPNPKEWIDKVNSEGLSSLQVIRLISGNQKTTNKVCKVCGAPQ